MNRMNYNEWCQYIERNLPQYMNDDDSIMVKLGITTRNNGIRQRVIYIHSNESPMVPRIPLEEAYEKYEKGMPLDIICEELTDMYRSVRENEKKLQIPEIRNYEKVKDMVVCSLINMRENQKLLQQRPYTQVDDLAAVYYVAIGKDDFGDKRMPITHAMRKMWKVSTETLHKDAIKNSPRLYPAKIEDMGDALSHFTGRDMSSERGSMYVLSNTEYTGGAAVILYPEVKRQIREQLGDCYMMPSSINEWILVPHKDAENISEAVWGQCIREINEISVKPEERLSDHLYRFNSKNLKIETVENSLEQLSKVKTENSPKL